MTANKFCLILVRKSAGDLSSDYVPSGSHDDGLWQRIRLRADCVQIFILMGLTKIFNRRLLGFLVIRHLGS